jgi:hypothetical protein
LEGTIAPLVMISASPTTSAPPRPKSPRSTEQIVRGFTKFQRFAAHASCYTGLPPFT